MTPPPGGRRTAYVAFSLWFTRVAVVPSGRSYAARAAVAIRSRASRSMVTGGSSPLDRSEHLVDRVERPSDRPRLASDVEPAGRPDHRDVDQCQVRSRLLRLVRRHGGEQGRGHLAYQ